MKTQLVLWLVIVAILVLVGIGVGECSHPMAVYRNGNTIYPTIRTIK